MESREEETLDDCVCARSGRTLTRLNVGNNGAVKVRKLCKRWRGEVDAPQGDLSGLCFGLTSKGIARWGGNESYLALNVHLSKGGGFG